MRFQVRIYDPSAPEQPPRPVATVVLSDQRGRACWLPEQVAPDARFFLERIETESEDVAQRIRSVLQQPFVIVSKSSSHVAGAVRIRGDYLAEAPHGTPAYWRTAIGRLESETGLTEDLEDYGQMLLKMERTPREVGEDTPVAVEKERAVAWQAPAREKLWDRIFERSAKADEWVAQCVLKVIDPHDGVISSATYVGRNSAGEGIALTDDHVVRPSGQLRQRVQVEFGGVQANAAVIPRPDESQKDIALLKIDAGSVSQFLEVGLQEPGISLSWKRGMPAVMAGYPSDTKSLERAYASIDQYYDTVLTSFGGEPEQRYLFFKFTRDTAWEGMSGGPVLEGRHGYLIGVIEGRHPTQVTNIAGVTQITAGGGLAIPLPDFLEDFQDELKGIKQRYNRRRRKQYVLLIIIALMVLVPAGLSARRFVTHISSPAAQPVLPDLFPKLEIARIGDQSAHGVVELLTGDGTVVAEIRGKLDRALPEGMSIFVVARRDNREEFELWGATEVNQSDWRMQARVTTPNEAGSARLELVPVVTRERPVVGEQKFKEWRQKNGVVTVDVKVASLTIDPAQSLGAYANLSGEAKNLSDGTKVVIETTNGRDDHWSHRADAEIRDNKWGVSRVPMRDPNQQGGRVSVRVRLSPDEKKVYSGDKVVSGMVDYSVPNPSLRITHINGQKVTNNSRGPEIQLNSKVNVKGEARNLLDAERIWVRIVGDKPNAIWPKLNMDQGLDAPRNHEPIIWSTDIEIGETVSTFEVKAGFSSKPPIGHEQEIREAQVPKVECRRR